MKTDLFQLSEWSKFADILLKHQECHLLGTEIAQLEFHYLHQLSLQWWFPRPIWFHTPGCLALGEGPVHPDSLGYLGLFLYSSSVYSFHLFLISSASVRSISHLSFIVPMFAWNVPLVSLIFLKRSLVFPVQFRSISLHCSLKKAFSSLLATLWNSALRWVYLSLSPLPFASLLSYL